MSSSIKALASPAPLAESAWHILFGKPRVLASLVLILGVGSHAVNGFVTAAVLPDIIHDLGGQERAFWVFTLYQVAAIVTGAATGTFKARYGAKALFTLAATALLAGSLTAGFADIIAGLLIGRALQGFAEGMILALCYAVIPDLYPERSVALVFSLLSTVWAVAAGVGPISAGLLTETWSWRAAFLANAPLTLILLLLALLVLPKDAKTRLAAPTRLGLAMTPRLLMIAAAVLLISLVGEMEDGLAITLTLVSGLWLTALMLWVDRRSASPIAPRQALSFSGIIGLGMWVELLMWVASGARPLYLTAFGQSVWGLSVTRASYVAATVAFSWTVAAWIVARVTTPARQLFLIRAGAAINAAGLASFGLALSHQSLGLFILSAAACGAGFGMSDVFLNKTIMFAAEGAERDRASAFLSTLRTAGAAIGAATAGFIGLTFGLTQEGSGDLVTFAAAMAAGPSVFLAMAAISALAFLTALRLRL